jgi:hypothetical protein
MEFIVSQKGGTLALYKGYTYRKDRVNGEFSTSWRCKDTGCKGRIIQHADGEIKTITAHTNAPDQTRIDSEKFLERIRRRAESSVDKPRQIIQGETCGNALDVYCNLPRYNALHQTIERRQRKVHFPQPTPHTLTDV